MATTAMLPAMTQIAECLAPFKAQAVERAEQKANKMIARMVVKLEACGWNLDVAAPRPGTDMSRAAYLQLMSTHNFYASITKSVVASRRMRDPRIVQLCDALVARFVECTKADAAAQYDGFVAKLQGKVGEHVDATLIGNHVWGYSILTVTLADGTKQRWKTQQIINVSSLGKLFNQWPSRKVR